MKRNAAASPAKIPMIGRLTARVARLLGARSALVGRALSEAAPQTAENGRRPTRTFAVETPPCYSLPPEAGPKTASKARRQKLASSVMIPALEDV